ncbi:MAG: transposase [Thermoguttaceae bacterium]
MATVEALAPGVLDFCQRRTKTRSNRACREDIFWILKWSARWKDMPERFPPRSICRRRLREWQEAVAFAAIRQAFLVTPDRSPFFLADRLGKAR